jgi:predicted transcriptional regulator
MLEYRKFSISKYCEIQNVLLNLPSGNQLEKKMKRKDNALTKVEFDVMNILWDIKGGACAWDILEHYEDPKPAYTTIATYLKVLYEKGFLDFHKVGGQGKTHRYVPLVTRAEYTRRTMQEVKKNFFGGSVKSMLNYFVSEEKLSQDEIKELLESVSNS